MAPLTIDHATKQFRQGGRIVQALHEISLEIRQGDFLAIMGVSGSGKSTLLHLMAGLTHPDTGRVIINGQDLNQLNDRQLTLFRRRNIGLVFQAFNLIPTLSSLENIRLPLLLDGRRNDKAQGEEVDAVIQLLGLNERQHHRPDALSGGEQQRVAIGRALVQKPAILLADEPTGNLDSVNSRQVCELLRDLSVRQDKTIVMVTHEPSVAVYAREVAVIKDGRLIKRFETAGQSSDGVALAYAEAIR